MSITEGTRVQGMMPSPPRNGRRKHLPCFAQAALLREQPATTGAESMQKHGAQRAWAPLKTEQTADPLCRAGRLFL